MKLVPSAEADSVLTTFPHPQLRCGLVSAVATRLEHICPTGKAKVRGSVFGLIKALRRGYCTVTRSTQVSAAARRRFRV